MTELLRIDDLTVSFGTVAGRVKALNNVSLSVNEGEVYCVVQRLDQIGTVATEFQRPVACLEDLIKELREGRYSPVDLRETVAP